MQLVALCWVCSGQIIRCLRKASQTSHCLGGIILQKVNTLGRQPHYSTASILHLSSFFWLFSKARCSTLLSHSLGRSVIVSNKRSFEACELVFETWRSSPPRPQDSLTWEPYGHVPIKHAPNHNFYSSQAGFMGRNRRILLWLLYNGRQWGFNLSCLHMISCSRPGA